MPEVPIKVGVVGCGKISGIYLKNCRQVFGDVEVVACADIIHERAAAQAAEYGVPAACSVEELLADPEIRIVLNLTIPNAHASASTTRSPLPSPAKRARRCCRPPRPRAFAWAVRRTPSWARGTRPAAS